MNNPDKYSPTHDNHSLTGHSIDASNPGRYNFGPGYEIEKIDKKLTRDTIKQLAGLAGLRDKLNNANEALDTDTLTGAKSRRALLKDLPALLEGPNASDVEVIALDLDKFKNINDMLGHAAGDSALVEIVNSFHVSLREGETLYRTGGDEFIIVIDKSQQSKRREESNQLDLVEDNRMGQDRRQEEDSVTGLGRRIVSVFERANTAFQEVSNGESKDVKVSGSFGIAEYIPGETAQEMLNRADKSLYESKRNLANEEGVVA